MSLRLQKIDWFESLGIHQNWFESLGIHQNRTKTFLKYLCCSFKMKRAFPRSDPNFCIFNSIFQQLIMLVILLNIKSRLHTRRIPFKFISISQSSAKNTILRLYFFISVSNIPESKAQLAPIAHQDSNQLGMCVTSNKFAIVSITSSQVCGTICS